MNDIPEVEPKYLIAESFYFLTRAVTGYYHIPQTLASGRRRGPTSIGGAISCKQDQDDGTIQIFYYKVSGFEPSYVFCGECEAVLSNLVAMSLLCL